MSDYGISVVFILFQELLGTRKRDLVNILINVIGSHADTIVAHGKGTGLLIDLHVDFQPIGRAVELTGHRQCFQFLCGIYRIGNYLTQENLMIAIKKLFDYGEYVCCGNLY